MTRSVIMVLNPNNEGTIAEMHRYRVTIAVYEVGMEDRIYEAESHHDIPGTWTRQLSGPPLDLEVHELRRSIGATSPRQPSLSYFVRDVRELPSGPAVLEHFRKNGNRGERRWALGDSDTIRASSATP